MKGVGRRLASTDLMGRQHTQSPVAELYLYHIFILLHACTVLHPLSLNTYSMQQDVPPAHRSTAIAFAAGLPRYQPVSNPEKLEILSRSNGERSLRLPIRLMVLYFFLFVPRFLLRPCVTYTHGCHAYLS